MESKKYSERLELRVSPRTDAGREEIEFYSGKKQVFCGHKLPQEAKLSWLVDPTPTKEDYLRKLLFFYEYVCDVNRERGGDVGRAPGLLVRGEDKGRVRREVLKSKEITGIALLSNPLYKNLHLLQVATPYVTFAMDGEDRKWNTDTGRISVSTSLDLSYRISKLIGETARYKVNATVLEEVLKDVYRFGKKRVESEIDALEE